MLDLKWTLEDGNWVLHTALGDITITATDPPVFHVTECSLLEHWMYLAARRGGARRCDTVDAMKSHARAVLQDVLDEMMADEVRHSILRDITEDQRLALERSLGMVSP